MTNINLQKIVIATRNSGKLGEFHTLLAPLNSTLLSLRDISLDIEVEETGSSFKENACLKAIEYSRLTQLPVLADDSGLEVEALGGRPGIHSARYAGPGASDSDRIQKLLKELKDVGVRRQARFVCVLALAHSGELLRTSEGECRGIIADEPRGSNGFGYDPIFLFPKLGKTYAELSESEKNQYSHRAHAVVSLLQRLRETGAVER
jgi:XTP/dITP diphosphohydrolase